MIQLIKSKFSVEPGKRRSPTMHSVKRTSSSVDALLAPIKLHLGGDSRTMAVFSEARRHVFPLAAGPHKATRRWGSRADSAKAIRPDRGSRFCLASARLVEPASRLPSGTVSELACLGQKAAAGVTRATPAATSLAISAPRVPRAISHHVRNVTAMRPESTDTPT